MTTADNTAEFQQNLDAMLRLYGWQRQTDFYYIKPFKFWRIELSRNLLSFRIAELNPMGRSSVSVALPGSVEWPITGSVVSGLKGAFKAYDFALAIPLKQVMNDFS